MYAESPACAACMSCREKSLHAIMPQLAHAESISGKSSVSAAMSTACGRAATCGMGAVCRLIK